MSETFEQRDGAGRLCATYGRPDGTFPPPVAPPQPGEPTVAVLESFADEHVDSVRRDRAVIVRCRMIEHMALAMLLPVLGVLGVVLLAGLCRLVWTLPV